MLSARPRSVRGRPGRWRIASSAAQTGTQRQEGPGHHQDPLPESPTKTTLKVEGKELEANDKAAKEGVRVLVTPELEPGKTYAYKIEAKIEPNNYTTIVRTREITFKAGEEVELDLRKKDDKIEDNVVIRWVPTPKVVVKDMCKLAKVNRRTTWSWTQAAATPS